MLMTITTVLTFELGEDDALLSEFMKTKDDEWNEAEYASVVSFTKAETIKVGP